MKKSTVPTFDELMNPTLQALKRLGGSASIDELVPEIVRLLELPQDVADVPMAPPVGRSWSTARLGLGPIFATLASSRTPNAAFGPLLLWALRPRPWMVA